MHDAANLLCTTVQQQRFPLVIAADHSTAASTIAGIRPAHPQSRLGVIWNDSHADNHAPFTTPRGTCMGTTFQRRGGLWANEAILLLFRLLSDPRVCCWEICEINPYRDELTTIAELSLGIFQAGLEVLGERFSSTSSSHAS
ncbi:arginase family protein [Synechococcus sp. CC9311]|uniref:arginase family protein n=1 Tax=Synechococcus sp. (strain CC9311) TaxID=64471 RepID=UPI00059B7710|nr:arginase family protein [Synechococcus sp. CC9311]